MIITLLRLPALGFIIDIPREPPLTRVPLSPLATINALVHSHSPIVHLSPGVHQ